MWQGWKLQNKHYDELSLLKTHVKPKILSQKSREPASTSEGHAVLKAP